ncbi:hypothetical protein L9F63_020807, partial [Diploptera punctata]
FSYYVRFFCHVLKQFKTMSPYVQKDSTDLHELSDKWLTFSREIMTNLSAIMTASMGFISSLKIALPRQEYLFFIYEHDNFYKLDILETVTQTDVPEHRDYAVLPDETHRSFR